MELTLDQIKERFHEFLSEHDAFQGFYKNLKGQKLKENFHDWLSGYFIWDSAINSTIWPILSSKWRVMCHDFVLVDKPKPKYKIGDKVKFRVKDWEAEYEITEFYLFNKTEHGKNSNIFIMLGIDNPHEFCSKIYGYEAGHTDFPEYRKNDFTAVEKIIRALQGKCYEVNSVWKSKPKIKELRSESINTTKEQILQTSFKFYTIKKKTYFI